MKKLHDLFKNTFYMSKEFHKTCIVSEYSNNKQQLMIVNKFSLHPDPECTRLIASELEKLDYEFSINDPSELAGENLHFYRGKYVSLPIFIVITEILKINLRDDVLLASGMLVDAIELYRDRAGKHLIQYKLLEYRTGKRPVVVSASIRPQVLIYYRDPLNKNLGILGLPPAIHLRPLSALLRSMSRCGNCIT